MKNLINVAASVINAEDKLILLRSQRNKAFARLLEAEDKGNGSASKHKEELKNIDLHIETAQARLIKSNDDLSKAADNYLNERKRQLPKNIQAFNAKFTALKQQVANDLASAYLGARQCKMIGIASAIDEYFSRYPVMNNPEKVELNKMFDIALTRLQGESEDLVKEQQSLRLEGEAFKDPMAYKVQKKKLIYKTLNQVREEA